jgi:Flp pilus assembly protein TadD
MALLGAAVIAVVLMVAAVVSVVQDPEVQSCAAALEAADQANRARQDAMRALEGRFRRGGVEAEVAELRVDRAEALQAAARADVSLACHYPAVTPDRT